MSTMIFPQEEQEDWARDAAFQAGGSLRNCLGTARSEDNNTSIETGAGLLRIQM